MEDVPGSIKPMVNRHGGFGKAQSCLCREELDYLPLNGDCVIIVYFCLMSVAEDIAYLCAVREFSEGVICIFGGNAKEACVFRDKSLVQVLRCLLSVSDVVQTQFSNQSVLQTSVDPLSPSSCLGGNRQR